MTSMMMDDIVAPDLRPLTAKDRCDGCGAQAYVRVTVKTGEILLCRHDWLKHADRLMETALAVHDETEKLLVKP